MQIWISDAQKDEKFQKCKSEGSAITYIAGILLTFSGACLGLDVLVLACSSYLPCL